MKKTELAYIAGAMDSDGFFTIKRNTYSVRKVGDAKYPSYSERAGIKQTTPQIIDLIHKNFGGYRSIQKPNTKNGKPLHSIDLRNKICHEFVKAIMPYLVLKKEQASILMELRKITGKRGAKKTIRQRTPHGTYANFTKHSVGEDILAIKESLVERIKSLNDTRSDEKHKPIPWR